MYTSTLNKNKPPRFKSQQFNYHASCNSQIQAPDQCHFLLTHRTSKICVEIHGLMEASRLQLKVKAYEQWHHWILEFQVPTTSSKSHKKSQNLGPIFMIFDPPNSNNINPQLYITKLLITKSSRSFANKCYNEPLRRDGEHRKKFVSSSAKRRGHYERRKRLHK